MALTWINGPTYKSILITQKSLNNKGVDIECIKRGYKLADSEILYQQWTNMIKYQKNMQERITDWYSINFIDQIFMLELYLGYFQKGAFRSYFFILIDSSWA